MTLSEIPGGGRGDECDIDDLMCQFQVMNHLEGMEKLLGSETFKSRFPEFGDLGGVVTERMREQEGTIKEALAKCGRPVPESVLEDPLLTPSEEVGDGDN